MAKIEDIGILIAAAECTMIILRRREIEVALKSDEEMTDEEQQMVRNGLKRNLVFDAILFTPCGAALCFLAGARQLLLALPISPQFSQSEDRHMFASATAGFLSYQFPLRSLKRMMLSLGKDIILNLAKKIKEGDRQ